MKKSQSAIVSLLVISLFSLTSLASDVADDALTTFQPNTTAKSSEVNANFSTLKDAVNSKQDNITGTCPSGQAIREIAADGTVTCETDDVGITSVTTDTESGLNGNGTPGDPLSIDTTNSIQERVTGTCAAGSAVNSVNENGGVGCETIPQGDVTEVTVSAGLSGGGNSGPVNISLDYFGGSGSAGDLTIPTDTDDNWVTDPPTDTYPTLEFANITINPRAKLTVPAGTTIRCSGNFTNNGTINVVNGPSHASTSYDLNFPNSAGPASTAHPGDSFGPATSGSFHDYFTGGSVRARGGIGGTGIPQTVAMTSFSQFRFGGGSGAGGKNEHANGGGLLKVYCNGSISNTGTINANGHSPDVKGLGGGGGGIVILAARNKVDNAGGTINANGGNGGDSNDTFGAGGGGGGGIVVLISPDLPSEGTINVNGGSPGESGTTVIVQGVMGGGGGGASGGNGGNGGYIDESSGITLPADDDEGEGDPGYFRTLQTDPIYLVH